MRSSKIKSNKSEKNKNAARNIQFISQLLDFIMRGRYNKTCSKIPEHEFVRWNNQWIFLHIKSISWIFIRRSHDGRDAGVHVNACCPRLLRCRRLNDVIGGNDVIASHRWRHVHSEQLKHGPPCSFVDILPARRCASAGTIAMALCLSVCMYVTSRCSIETVERIELVFGVGAFFDLFCTAL